MKKNLQTNVLLISVYSCKIQFTVEKSAPSFEFPFGPVLTKLKVFHVVEEKMYHARQTFKVNCHLFVISTKSLIFDLTMILLPKLLVLTYSLIVKIMHYQIPFTELKSSY